MNVFSFARFWALVVKEFIQMKRDKVTFAMLVGIPIMQLIVFGYAINANPKHLPIALVSADSSQFTRDYIHGLENTDYFKFMKRPSSEQQAKQWMAAGKVLFILNIPPAFTSQLLQGKHPQMLLTGDATDPTAIGNALAAANHVAQIIFNQDLQGPLSNLQFKPGPVDLIIHEKYNPEIITQYNIVPGLMGVILTMTMVMITSLAITREYERGTMESLLATPARPLEVMLGKITPYIIVAYLQIFLTLIFSYFVFSVPFVGDLGTLLICAFPFIIANLGVGLTFSTVAKNQLQAMQMTFFFFLPSILLSGFLFPFAGMPEWARWIGEVLPLTHFVRLIRGIMLKGTGWIDAWSQLWPLIVFLIIVMGIGLLRYRQTLD